MKNLICDKSKLLLALGLLVVLVLALAGTQNLVLAQNPQFSWPVVDGASHVSQNYSDGHKALDMLSSGNDTIYAAHDGVVVYAVNGHADKPDGGLMIQIHHDTVGDGQFHTWYAHLASALVSSGRVTKGQPIGIMGCSGECTGKHLHFVLAHGANIEADSVNPIPDYLSGNPGDDNVSPSVSINTPHDNDKFINQIPVSLNASDNEGGSGVKFVRVKLHYNGAWHDELTQEDSNGGDGWNVVLNVPGDANNAPDVKIDALVEDNAGNQGGPDTRTGLVIDQSGPTVEITTPSDGASFETSIHTEANASDNRGVTRVVFKLHYLGEWRHEVQDTNGGDGWKADFTGLSVPPGTNDVKIDAIAYDEVGNSTVDTVFNLQPFQDTTPPSLVEVREPHTADMLSGNHAVLVRCEDAVGCHHVDLFVYYSEYPGQGQEQHMHNIPTLYAGTSQAGDWRYENALFSDVQNRAIAQTGAFVQAIGYDARGNSTTSQPVYFNVKIDQTIYVDARAGWVELPVRTLQNSEVKFGAIGGTSYSAPGQPQTAWGDAGVCLGSSNCLSLGASKALVSYYDNCTGGAKSYINVLERYENKSQYACTRHFVGFNDINGQFQDNSGAFDFRLEIYPPGSGMLNVEPIGVKENAVMSQGQKPWVMLWLERLNAGHTYYQFLGQWAVTPRADFTYDWTIDYPRDTLEDAAHTPAVWVQFTNGLPDQSRIYYLRIVRTPNTWIVGPENPTTQYRFGDNPFFAPTQTVCCTETMKWTGAQRILLH